MCQKDGTSFLNWLWKCLLIYLLIRLNQSNNQFNWLSEYGIIDSWKHLD